MKWRALAAVLGVWATGVSATADQDAPKPGEADNRSTWPGIRLNLEDRWVDLEATVVLREGEWVELLACTPNSREHESVLTVDAKPSHVHLALLALGLEPGQPRTARRVGQEWVSEGPSGPPVAVSVVTSDEDGEETQTPASRWIVRQKSGEPLADEPWVFAGSRFVKLNQQDIYAADLNGSVVSIVNFGDEVLARRTDLTNQTDAQAFDANTEAIPPIGTRVILRLKPLDDDAPADVEQRSAGLGDK